MRLTCKVWSVAAAAVCSLLVPPAALAEKFPTKPIQLVIPFAPGDTDQMLRPIVDLPHPDSPTNASVSPGCTLNDTFSTACTMPRSRDSNPEPMR